METEIWKDIAGYEGLYQVSNLGNVKSLERITPHGHCHKERILSPGRKIYVGVNLSKNDIHKSHNVHVLVALHFIPNPENKRYVNHKDGNKWNNHHSNLEWNTPTENSRHAVATGLHRPPQDSPAWKRIKVENQSETLLFMAIRKAEKALKINRTTIKKALRDGRVHKGYLFSYVQK